jgi:hypothetical protein
LILKLKEKPATGFRVGSGFGKSLYGQLHDHPATGVVMPVRMMAVIDIPKHSLVGLIPDWMASCQTYVSQDLQDFHDEQDIYPVNRENLVNPVPNYPPAIYGLACTM